MDEFFDKQLNQGFEIDILEKGWLISEIVYDRNADGNVSTSKHEVRPRADWNSISRASKSYTMNYG